MNRRLIFALLYSNGNYQLSRNFNLQAVGDLNWVRENYDLESIGCSIDELMVLNVDRRRNKASRNEFASALSELVQTFFMPVCAGGDVSSVDDARTYLASGADKVAVNSALYDAPEAVVELVKTFGSQCVVASIDYRGTGLTSRTFKNFGHVDTQMNLQESIRRACDLGVGEIVLQSIDKDGTGQNFDITTLTQCNDWVECPLIALGGAGRDDHLAECLKLTNVSAACTANLFNFMANGLKDAREEIRTIQVPIASWDMEFYRRLYAG